MYDLSVVRRSNLLIAVVAVLAFLAARRGFSQEVSQILDREFPYDVDRPEGPLVSFEEFLRDSDLSGGIVLMSECQESPPVHLKAKQGSTFREVLDDFEAANPSYHWEIRGNVLNLIPAAGIPPLLAAKVRSFELQTMAQQTRFSLVFQRLLELPEIRQAATGLGLKEGTYYGGLGVYQERPEPEMPLPIYVRLNNVPLQDALNAVAQAYGHTVWWYRQRACRGEVTYTLEDSRAY